MHSWLVAAGEWQGVLTICLCSLLGTSHGSVRILGCCTCVVELQLLAAIDQQQHS